MHYPPLPQRRLLRVWYAIAATPAARALVKQMENAHSTLRDGLRWSFVTFIRRNNKIKLSVYSKCRITDGAALHRMSRIAINHLHRLNSVNSIYDKRHAEMI
jgi:hypothetical protein